MIKPTPYLLTEEILHQKKIYRFRFKEENFAPIVYKDSKIKNPIEYLNWIEQVYKNFRGHNDTLDIWRVLGEIHSRKLCPGRTVTDRYGKKVFKSALELGWFSFASKTPNNSSERLFFHAKFFNLEWFMNELYTLYTGSEEEATNIKRSTAYKFYL